MTLSEKDLSEEQGRPPDRTAEDTEFLDYVLILFRYRWLIFWTVGLCTAGILLYASQQEPEFQSVATIHAQHTTSSVSLLSSFPLRRNIVRKLHQYELNGETHIIDLTETLGSGSEYRAVVALNKMVHLHADQKHIVSIVVTSPSPRLSVVVGNAVVVQLLQMEYDILKSRRKIEKINGVTDEFEKLQMEMDKVGAEVFQGFEIGNVRVLSLAVPGESRIGRYGMNVVLAVGLAIGVCLSVLLVFLIEYGRHKPELLASLTNELRKDVEWVGSRLGKK